MMLTKNLTELVMSGTSGRSKVRVEVPTAISIADDKVEKAENQRALPDFNWNESIPESRGSSDENHR